MGTNWAWWGGIAAGAAGLVSIVPMIRRRAMKITNILMKDHRLVSGMMATLEMTPKVNGMVRKSIFNQIRTQLLLHAQAEEEVFYPAVRNLSFGHTETYVNDAYREHQNMKDLLNELWRMDAMSDEFDRKFKDLRATVLHHVEEEEGKIFPMVERNMSSERLEELGYRFHNRKVELKKQATSRAA